MAIAALFAAGPTGRAAPAGLARPSVTLAPSAASLRVTAPVAGPTSPQPGDLPGSGGPACVGEVCQPIVSVPGFEPRWRKSRHELALALLERADIQPISGLAGLFVRSGIQFDFQPAVLDSGTRHGWGRLMLGFRWQLGAPRER